MKLGTPDLLLGLRLHMSSNAFGVGVFGHFESSCKYNHRCAMGHRTPDCALDQPQFKCVYCGQNDSAAYGCCCVYKNAKEVKSVFVILYMTIPKGNQAISEKKLFASVVSGIGSSFPTSFPSPTITTVHPVTRVPILFPLLYSCPCSESLPDPGKVLYVPQNSLGNLVRFL